jgi:hypothetical protein
VADYSNPLNPPSLTVNGSPGNYNFVYSTASLNQYPTASGCVQGTDPIPTSIEITSDQGLTEGVVSHGGTITITFDNNDIYTGDYLEMSIESVDYSINQATGKFQMFATIHGNTTTDKVLVIKNGFFSGKF